MAARRGKEKIKKTATDLSVELAVNNSPVELSRLLLLQIVLLGLGVDEDQGLRRENKRAAKRGERKSQRNVQVLDNRNKSDSFENANGIIKSAIQSIQRETNGTEALVKKRTLVEEIEVM